MGTSYLNHYTPEQLARRRAQRAARRRRKKLLQILVISAGIGILLVLVLVLRGIWKLTEGPRARARYGTAEYAVENYRFDPEDPRLMLVNSNCPLPESYVPETAVVDAATGQSLETEAAAALADMVQAAAAEHITLQLESGYRDPLLQQSLFRRYTERCDLQGHDQAEAEAIARTVVKPAGACEHQTGYAADIISAEHGIADLAFAKTKAFAWLSRYAPDYGFILRYPAEREAATGNVFEPWHWRYVGVENAQAITASGLSLEEFLALHGEEAVGA